MLKLLPYNTKFSWEKSWAAFWQILVTFMVTCDVPNSFFDTTIAVPKSGLTTWHWEYCKVCSYLGPTSCRQAAAFSYVHNTTHACNERHLGERKMCEWSLHLPGQFTNYIYSMIHQLHKQSLLYVFHNQVMTGIRGEISRSVPASIRTLHIPVSYTCMPVIDRHSMKV